jgi:hypothetical protein
MGNAAGLPAWFETVYQHEQKLTMRMDATTGRALPGSGIKRLEMLVYTRAIQRLIQQYYQLCGCESP